jgi:hypothetical protein
VLGHPLESRLNALVIGHFATVPTDVSRPGPVGSWFPAGRTADGEKKSLLALVRCVVK